MRTSSPTRRASMRESSSGRGKPSSIPGPSPEIRGATKTSSLSTSPRLEERCGEGRPAFEENGLDAVGGELLELLAERSRAELELGPFRQRASPERDSARLLDYRHIARVEAWVVGAHRAHPDRDGVGLRAEHVDEPPGVLSGYPA